MSRKPYAGMMVQYRWRPGQVRAGQQDAAAMITRVKHDGKVDLTIYPPSAEHIHQQDVMAMSQEVTSHCWHVPEDEDSPQALRVAELEGQLAEALDRLDALEKKPAAEKSQSPPKSKFAGSGSGSQA